jgi:hypothetical protein
VVTTGVGTGGVVGGRVGGGVMSEHSTGRCVAVSKHLCGICAKHSISILCN